MAVTQFDVSSAYSGLQTDSQISTSVAYTLYTLPALLETL